MLCDVIQVQATGCGRCHDCKYYKESITVRGKCQKCQSVSINWRQILKPEEHFVLNWMRNIHLITSPDSVDQSKIHKIEVIFAQAERPCKCSGGK